MAKVTRSSVRYVAQARKDHLLNDQSLPERLEQIKAKHPRFGSPRIHAMLNKELAAERQIESQQAEYRINHKRVERLWRKSGLQVLQRAKKRKIKTGRMVSPQAKHPISAAVLPTPEQN